MLANSRFIRFLVIGLVVALLLSLFFSTRTQTADTTSLSISTLAQEVLAGTVDEIRVDDGGREVIVSYVDAVRENGRSQISRATSLEDVLSAYGVSPQTYVETGTEIVYEQPSQWTGVFNALGFILPLLLIAGIFYFIFRQQQTGGNQATQFGKSKARMFTGDHPTVTFKDVAGVDESKEELREIVDFLRNPDKFVKMGARIPKGVLLVGQPGTGKTLLAKAVSGEAGVPFFSIAGSEFVEMFVGVGASRVRDLFEQAKRHSPCIIFMDEIDAVGRQRGAGLGGSHDEREQTLNQILVEMDGFGTDTHIIMLAATNRPDILDPALVRPGRFDRRVIIDAPDIKGREEIFAVHMKGKPLAKDINIKTIARSTPGFVGADIENCINEAALLSARRNKSVITRHEIDEAIERVQLGPERRSRVVSEQERELTAYHEAGHALVAHLLPEALGLRKVTIIPRGFAGGVTWFMGDDQSYMTRGKIMAQIATALGGRVAEEIIYGEVTTGASNDLQQVTKMAKAMITQYGMSNDLGLRTYGEKQEMVFLGKEISEQRDYSDAIAEKIDLEVRQIIDTQHTLTTQLLTDNKDMLELVTQTLLEVETLDAEEFGVLIETGAMPPESTPKVAEKPQQVDSDASNWQSPPSLDLPSASPA